MPSGSVDDELGYDAPTMHGIVGGTRVFDRFSLQKVLGRGGMGVVWLAKDERLDRLVALKLLPEALCFDAAAQEDLKRETRKSLMLTHPNIVRIFDFIEDGKTAAISMEYVDGATLSALRVQRTSRCFEVSELANWTTALCDALAYAHESARVIHRDLKPANIMVNSRSELKVTDFGIACTLRDSMSYVSVRTSSGTLNYMSPQQMLGDDPAPADDIYALGATLYELLSSKPPFFGGDIASQVREVVAPTIAERRLKFGHTGETIPKHWEETIAACLAKTPERRPKSAAEVARRLRLGGTIRLQNATVKRKLHWPIDPRLAAVIAGIALLVVAILGLRSGHRETVRQEAKAAAPTTGFAMEAPAKLSTPARVVAAPPALLPVPKVGPTHAPDIFASSGKQGSIQLTTTPAGATYAIYAGVIAGKTLPSAPPLRTGTTPEAVEQLPAARYTIFFHVEGWPDDRAEVALEPGENLPVDYTFQHGTVNITSTPDGAEILRDSISLGTTPLTVDLPAGAQQLTARSASGSDKTQSVTIEQNKTATLAFQFTRTRTRSPRPRATPPPSAFDKVGNTFKKLFGAKPSPTPRRKHH